MLGIFVLLVEWRVFFVRFSTKPNVFRPNTQDENLLESICHKDFTTPKVMHEDRERREGGKRGR